MPLVLILLLALFAMTNEYTNLQSSFIVQWTPVDTDASTDEEPSPHSLTEKRISNSTENETEINPKFAKTKQSTMLPTSISSTQTTPYLYDARLEIDKRRDHLKLWCDERDSSPGFKSMNYRTGYVSKWGRSLGGVNFWSCFTPKCASTSFSVAVLAATGTVLNPPRPFLILRIHLGYITPKDYNGDVDLDAKWDDGRNKCPAKNKKCLHSYHEMPDQFKKMDPAKIDDPFTSVIFVREPMDRLVSAWKDKIHTYSSNFTKSFEKSYIHNILINNIIFSNNWKITIGTLI